MFFHILIIPFYLKSYCILRTKYINLQKISNQYLPMKKLLTLIFIICPTVIWANVDFVLFRNDGTKQVYTISEHGGVYFDTDKLLISEFYGTQVEEPIANIQKITFENYPTVETNNATITDNVVAYPNPTRGEIYLFGAKENTLVSLYSLNGQCLINQVDIATLNTQLPSLDSGLYMLRVNNQIIKICKL